MRACALSFVVAVAVLLSGVARADEMPASGAEDSRARVAILPMVVNTVGERGYLRSGLADMLASRLGRHEGVAVVRVEAESKATTDPERAAEIGLEHGAQYVVFGSFTQFGEGASLDVHCLSTERAAEDADPRARRVFIQSGKVGEIIPKLDATAQKIGLFVAGAMAPELPAVAAAPPAVAPAAPAANEAGVEDLRRRIEAVEDYLFGNEGAEKTAEAQPEGGASQELRLR